ncbi:hypothetical protein HIM_07724 [Hirsutella minnesotensis 3608]|uniref:DUF4484 domain-containing protein n=1 Tax=Hirsutella minnesotensis 3608 TaxID=1043627 RepID=A0A0F7ZHN7_9HYPO|nr:hypothetical protein HIM_07724 [Hirsutella minnesotensis 3608]
MAPARRHRHSSSWSLSNAADRPPLSALFLIDFDVKAGYTISWKRALPGLDLDGRVEYKSLPSGLHTVATDLIYFVHDAAHAGLSAFVNEPCDEEEARNARMIAVGILVPLSYGRLGRAWRHAQDLEKMAVKLAKDRNMTEVLERYWQANKGDSFSSPDDEPPPVDETPLSPTHDRAPPSRSRSVSDGAALHLAEHRLSPHHPAWSLTKLLDRFGPLIFPIHRAALLRKRILISCQAPVHEICDFVYNISVLANIPLSISDSLPSSAPSIRLRPLFTIGVHDIPFLMEDLEASRRKDEGEEEPDCGTGSGWIACTTDSILAMKDTLWDMLITMPPNHLSSAKDLAWPVVECPRGNPIRATQRDLRRYNTLRNGLSSLEAPSLDESTSSPRPENTARRLSTGHRPRVVQEEFLEHLVEPPSWAALAYNGYMWWASAGEQVRAEEQEESARDAALLANLAPSPHNAMAVPRPLSASDLLAASVTSFAGRRASDSDEARVELAIIAYFHRLTTQMLSVASDLVDSADEAYPERYRDEDEGEGEALLDANGDEQSDTAADVVVVDSQHVDNMGLDVWSAADTAFIQDVFAAYFDRSARVEGKGVEVCGVRVC